MDILMVTAELAPYAKVTEAGDSVASLGKALRQLGHEVTIALPRYRAFEGAGLLLARRLSPLQIPSGGEVTVFDGQLPSGVRIVLFDAPALFDRDGIYDDGSEPYEDNAERFALLSQAAAALVRARSQQGHAFDLVHVHDWPAALAAALIRQEPGPRLPCVLTIHDASRDGTLSSRILEAAGARVAGAAQPDPADSSALACGAQHADVVTTVSTAYAQLLAEPGASGPVAQAIEGRNGQPVGIPSAVDYALCNPATDPLLVGRYDAEDAASKELSKGALLRELGLRVDLSRPLIVVRVLGDDERCFELPPTSITRMLKLGASLVLAFDGEVPASLQSRVRSASARHSESFAAMERLEPAAVHRLFAAADIMGTTAVHSPSGALALWAQRYGAAPVVLAAAGHLDCVVDCDAALETGTGFLFDDADPSSLLGALQRATSSYGGDAWFRLRRRMMRLDRGWDRPARRYVQVYRHALSAQA